MMFLMRLKKWPVLNRAGLKLDINDLVMMKRAVLHKQPKNELIKISCVVCLGVFATSNLMPQILYV